MKPFLRITAILFLGLFILSSAGANAQILKTNLMVMVLDELGNVQNGASVSIYENEEDYNAKENAVASNLLTDEKGRVKIKKLEEKEYYISVEKGDKNNAGAGVKTGKLVTKKTNKVNIVISGI